MSRVLFILFLTLSLLAQNMALYGQVSGTVITLEGTPLADAIVYALPETAMLKPPLTTHADSDGKFSFTGLPEGGIYLDASKDSEGYL